MYSLLKRIFPICRSITGNGVRETLKIIGEQIPLKITEVPTGTKCFDWEIPKEWNIQDAYILDEQGNKIVNFKQNNLHIVGYSIPVNKTLTLEELNKHLYSMTNKRNAIPYITSYYAENWGFCLTYNQRMNLKKGNYTVVIDSELKDGSLTYAEVYIPGKTKEEIFLSTYVCHPSMANNECSGPVVVTEIVKWLMSEPRKYSYRIVFVPETIGSIAYLSKNYVEMQQRIIAGFNISCVGDNRNYSVINSRTGKTLADKVALNVLNTKYPGYKQYSFLHRGSDERQYCSPVMDLPVVTLCRSKFCEYPEYHTSLDNLDLVTEEGLHGGFNLVKDCISVLECNNIYKSFCMCEPQYGKRGLYPTISTGKYSNDVTIMKNFMVYVDGKSDLIDISNTINVPVYELNKIANKMKNVGLIFNE